MKDVWHKIYQKLEKETDRHIYYFDKNQRCVKSFKDFMQDVNKAITLLKEFSNNADPGKKIGIIGNTSYMWMILDHACTKGGFQSVAIPETFSQEALNEVILELKLDFILVDYSLFNVFSFENAKPVYFNANHDFTGDCLSIKESTIPFVSSENLIQEDYSIVFSSGTSEKVKYINRKFFKEEPTKKPNLFKKINLYFQYRGTIWMNLRNKRNKIIIFLPFSHPMQRDFVSTGLANKMDILLSNPENCIKHIMMEKPNIMVSIPPVYDAIAELIEARLRKFTDKEKKLFNLFTKLGLNKKGDKHFLKKWFSKRLFEKVKKVYGGHADLFITGSAPIKKSTLESFYKVGVKIYEAYSQSELSLHIINSPKHFKIGSVGKPAKGTVKIDENSEVLIKFNKEYDTINEKVLNVKDNYIHTGDSGYIDKDGFLFITGRVDDVIVLDRGKKVHPLKLEKKLNQIPNVKISLVYSPNGHDINAFLFSVINTPGVIKELVQKVNKELLDHERISSISIIGQEPSIDNGLLTSTMKLKRKKVIRDYQNMESISI